jgi:hypothetical protein
MYGKKRLAMVWPSATINGIKRAANKPVITLQRKYVV